MSLAHSHQATDEWAAISRSRADLYSWFSALFAAELTDTGVAAYQAGQAQPVLDALAAIGLDQETTRLRNALAGWGLIPDLRVELAADFARLFLIDTRDAASPYASTYLDRQLFGAPHKQMQAFLLSGGLKVHTEFKEPADHLAVFLAFMEDNARKAADIAAQDRDEASQLQADFLHKALLSWLPQFDARSQALRGKTASDFYQAVTALLLAFVHADADFLVPANEAR